jgi:hypothetical protein
VQEHRHEGQVALNAHHSRTKVSTCESEENRLCPTCEASARLSLRPPRAYGLSCATRERGGMGEGREGPELCALEKNVTHR